VSRLCLDAAIGQPARRCLFSRCGPRQRCGYVGRLLFRWQRNERFISLEEYRRKVFGEESYTLENRNFSQFQAGDPDAKSSFAV